MHGKLDILISMSLSNLGLGPPARHWGLEIFPQMIARSESLLLILTKHSNVSESVKEEVRLYPNRKPVWIAQINGETVPESLSSRPNVHVCNININLPLLFAQVLEGAAKFQDQKNWLRQIAYIMKP
jgi:hypothetical protein